MFCHKVNAEKGDILSPPPSNILLPFVDGPRLYEYIIHVLQVDINHQPDHSCAIRLQALYFEVAIV